MNTYDRVKNLVEMWKKSKSDKPLREFLEDMEQTEWIIELAEQYATEEGLM